MFLGPDKFPGSVFVGVLTADLFIRVVFGQTSLKVIGVAEIEPSASVLKNIDPEHT